MMTFAVCDDEPWMAQEISSRLAAYMQKTGRSDYAVSCFSNGRALLESGSFDVVFLDIQMEPPDGMETARLLRQRGERSLLIFVTVLRECVFDAFEVEAYDFLTKPLEDGRFHRTMDRALRLLEEREESALVIRRNGGCEVVPLAGLVYCEVQGRKLYLHLESGRVLDYYDRLEALERRLDRRFFRCHRSYLVNLDWVRGCREGQLTLAREGPIPVSRLRERELTRALLRRMGEI